MSILKRYSPALVCFAIAAAATLGLEASRLAFVVFSVALTVACVVAEVERARIRGGFWRRDDAGN